LGGDVAEHDARLGVACTEGGHEAIGQLAGLAVAVIDAALI